MGSFDLEAEGLERVDDVSSGLLALVGRRQVEVTARVLGSRSRLAVLVLKEQEELALHAGVHGEAHLPGLFEDLLQPGSRASLENGAVRKADVADQASHFPALQMFPGKIRKVLGSGKEACLILPGGRNPRSRNRRT